MDEEIKKQWVLALNSGEYAQSGGSLRSPTGYCCLGVLCDLHAKATNSEWTEEERASYDMEDTKSYEYYNCFSDLPINVVAWSGLTTDRTKLMIINDEGQSFNTIANVILNNY